MYTIEPKRITTMTAVITLDQTEIAALIINPQPLINDLRSLHNAWQQPAPKDTPPRKAKSAPAKVDQFKTFKCPICKQSFKKQGSLNRHQANAHDGDTEIGAYKTSEE